MNESGPEESTNILTSEESSPRKKNGLIEFIKFAFLALIIVVPFRMFVAEPFVVSGASMEQTLHDADYLIVDKVSLYFREPRRGEVLVFDSIPGSGRKTFIKRLVGLPGETVRIAEDTVTIITAESETIVLDEPYTDGPTIGDMEVTLGEDEYFVLGDNRDNSLDSRIIGPVNAKEVTGRALLRLLPVHDFEVLPGDHHDQY